MTKRFTCEIDPALDIRLSVYAAHLSTTKAIAGARAMAQGIPTWVGAVPPSEAKRMASTSEHEEALTSELADFEQAFEEKTAPGLDEGDDWASALVTVVTIVANHQDPRNSDRVISLTSTRVIPIA